MGCKIHYFTEKESLVTTEIKQYPIKAKEDLSLRISTVYILHYGFSFPVCKFYFTIDAIHLILGYHSHE